jgi:hypothetical protein
MFLSKNNSTKFVLTSLLFLIISSFALGQDDCFLSPLKDAVKHTEYIVVFEADSLIYDSLDMELRNIFQHKRSKIALGRIDKILKSPTKEGNLCETYVIEWDYIFEEGGKYLLFLNERKGNYFRVEPCTYSEVFSSAKNFKKLFFTVNKYVLLSYYEAFLNQN